MPRIPPSPPQTPTRGRLSSIAEEGAGRPAAAPGVRGPRPASRPQPPFAAWFPAAGYRDARSERAGEGHDARTPPNSASNTPPSSPPPNGPVLDFSRGTQTLIDGDVHCEIDRASSDGSDSSDVAEVAEVVAPRSELRQRPVRLHPLSRRSRPSLETLETYSSSNDVDANGDPMALRYAWLDRNGDPKNGGTLEGGITNGRSEFGGTRRGPRIAVARPNIVSTPTTVVDTHPLPPSVASWFTGSPYTQRTLKLSSEGSHGTVYGARLRPCGVENRWSARGFEEDLEGEWVGR